MLRFSFRVKRLDKIKSKIIHGTVYMRQLHDKLKQLKLRRFGHAQRRREDYVVEECYRWSYQAKDLKADLSEDL